MTDCLEPVICDRVEDIRSLAQEMFKAAKGDPIDSPPPYSKTADEAFERAKNPKIVEDLRTSGTTRCVILGRALFVTLVLTLDQFDGEPSYHLSMSLLLGPKKVGRVPDVLAEAIVKVFFGDKSKAIDNPTALSLVRHYSMPEKDCQTNT